MLASSKDPYGNGFREVEIVEEDKDEYGKFVVSTQRRQQIREYLQRIKGTAVYERRKEYIRAYQAKERKSGYNRGGEWNKQNRLRCREYGKKYSKESGKSKRQYQKVGTLVNEILKDSGYARIAHYLRCRKMSAPKNFTCTLSDNHRCLKKGQWAWTFAHP